jgi:hypothetical protein
MKLKFLWLLLFNPSILHGGNIYPDFYFRKNINSPIPQVYGHENGAILLAPKPQPEVTIPTGKPSFFLPKPLGLTWQNNFLQRYFKNFSYNLIHCIIFVQLMMIHTLFNFFSPMGLFNEGPSEKTAIKWLLIAVIIGLEIVKIKIKNNRLTQGDMALKSILLLLFFLSKMQFTRSKKIQPWITYGFFFMIFIHQIVNNIIFFLNNNRGKFWEDFMIKNLLFVGLLVPLWSNLIVKYNKKLQYMDLDTIGQFQSHIYKDNYIFIYTVLTYIWIFSLLYQKLNDYVVLQGWKKLIFISFNSFINNLLYFFIESYSHDSYKHHCKTAIFFGFLIIIFQLTVKFPLGKYAMIFWSSYLVFLMQYGFSSLFNQFKIKQGKHSFFTVLMWVIDYLKQWLVNPFVTDTPAKEQASLDGNNNKLLDKLYEKVKTYYQQPSGIIGKIFKSYNYMNQLPKVVRRWVILNGFVYFVLT